jgi:hypothetical protein
MSLMAALAVGGVELNVGGYFSITHPEWPRMQMPPGTNLTLIARAGGGFCMDDTHFQYSSPKVETNAIVKTFPARHQVQVNVLTNIPIDIEWVKAMDRLVPGTLTNFPANLIVTNPITRPAPIDRERRLPDNINILSPTFQEDLEKWKAERHRSD